jgi:decaprenylphospho-beta-D-ribofuranose 2-oxidase
MKTAVLSGWGRVPVVPGVEIRSENLEQLTRNLPLARGLGRAYGDAALPAPGDLKIAGTSLADRILAFDQETGLLTAEAGLSLDHLCRVFLPRGFFTPVTPGTRFVTVGGMGAADVHGKNHHRDGCFGEHIVSLKVRVGDGRIVSCSRTEHEDLFRATIGGMGLTGPILEVTFSLSKVPSPWIYEERRCISGIDEFLEALDTAAVSWPMTVGWVDALSRGGDLGRGVLFCGRWAKAEEAPRYSPPLLPQVEVPFNFPDFAPSRLLVRAFNAVTWRRYCAAARNSIVHPYTYFYPLDQIGQWTRLYGRRGFIQYQCVFPRAAGPHIVRECMSLLTRKGGAFLGVIKDCGPEGLGMLSFPMRGISLALDIPMSDGTQSLVDALNELVISAGGRIYLAKDALTRRQHFRAMDPRLDAFLAVRERWDPQRRIRSAQSVRLFGW